MTETIVKEINEVKVLVTFKEFCKSYEDRRYQLRNILAYSKDKTRSIFEIVKREQNIELKDDECNRMAELVEAFLNKSEFRKPISKAEKEFLLIKQQNKCALCECLLDDKYHADHIIPFKYVGDELKNNWQMLCPHCNEKKSDSLDYQIRFLLKLI